MTATNMAFMLIGFLIGAVISLLVYRFCLVQKVQRRYHVVMKEIAAMTASNWKGRSMDERVGYIAGLNFLFRSLDASNIERRR